MHGQNAEVSGGKRVDCFSSNFLGHLGDRVEATRFEFPKHGTGFGQYPRNEPARISPRDSTSNGRSTIGNER